MIREKIVEKTAWCAAGALACLALLWAFGWVRPVRGDSPGPGEPGKGGEAHPSRGEHRAVRFTPGQREEFGILLAEAGPGTLRITREFPGEVVFNPERVVHLVPRAAGIVREVRKELGDPVEEGEVLALIESPALGTAKGEFLSRKRMLDLARTDLERARAVRNHTRKLLEYLAGFPSLEQMRKKNFGEMGEARNRLVSTFAEFVFAREALAMEKRLYREKISSRADLLAAERALKKARAALETARESVAFEVERDLLAAERAFQVAEFKVKAAERKLHVLGLGEKELAGLGEENDRDLACYELRAPAKGVITAKHVTRGEMVKGGDRLFTIADPGVVWVRLTVYQKDIQAVRPGKEVTLRGDRVALVGTGRISYVTPFLDEATRTAAARVVLENPEGRWKPGMFVSGAVLLEEVEVPLLLPESAFMEMEGRKVVFVETQEGLEPRPVKTGRRDGRFVEVLEGIRRGELYVRENAFTVKAELEKASLGEGHSH